MQFLSKFSGDSPAKSRLRKNYIKNQAQRGFRNNTSRARNSKCTVHQANISGARSKTWQSLGGCCL